MMYDDAFAAFYADEAPVVYAFLLRLGAGFDDAADATGHAFTEACAHWDRIRNPRAYVRTVARNHLIRAAGRRTTDIERARRACWSTDTIQDTYARDEVGRVLDLLKKLPDRQREVMAWFYDGFTVGEIAEFTGTKVDTVHSNLRHARRSLRSWGVGRHD